MSGTEKLLAGMVREAAGRKTVKAEDGSTSYEPTVPFIERMKLVNVVANFQAIKHKLTPSEPDAPSEFERMMNEHNGKGSGDAAEGPQENRPAPRRKRDKLSRPIAAGEGDEFADRFDALAPPGTDPYDVAGRINGNARAN